MKKLSLQALCFLLCTVSLYGFAVSKSPVVKSKSNSTETKHSGIEKTAANQAWRQLFNGKDLTGWYHVGKGSMSVEDGLIRGHGGMGLLYYTGGAFGNCTIRVVYKMQKENSNSGVFIRIPIEPHEEWMPVYYGYEVQIDNNPETSGEDDTHVTGCLYSINKALARPGKPGPEWNTMEITLDGPRTIVMVNSVKVTDYKEGDPAPERKFDFEPFRGRRPNAGYIGLQNHGDNDVVYFKEVSVKPLAKSKKIKGWKTRKKQAKRPA